MATIGNNKGGFRRILFFASDGTRKTIHLGKVSKAEAHEYALYIEKLLTATKRHNAPDEKTAAWVDNLDDAMHAKLVKKNLVPSRETGNGALGAFIDAFIASKPNAKPQTIDNIKQCRRWLVNFFGENRDMRTVTPADADDWNTHMLKTLGENTAHRHIGRARQVWKVAIRRKLVRDGNPFEGLSATVRGDPKKFFMVTREDAQKVINACPDAEWKLLFALSRYGGLRCPSEHLALKWGDITWGDADTLATIRVPSPKTEHHKGKECRIIPMFPELRQHLQDVYDKAEPGTEYVITHYRGRACNLRTQLGRIIRKAGLKVWPKIWHNLRATRQTELAETYPMHVVCQWIGNSQAIAQEHYLHVTDAHFAAATQPTTHSTTQQVAESNSTQEQEAGAIADSPLDSATCNNMQHDLYPQRGWYQEAPSKGA